MKLLNFTIIKLTVCLVLGILVGHLFIIPFSTVLCLSLVTFLLLAITYTLARKQFLKTIWFGLLAFILMIFVGISTVHIHNEKNYSNHFTRHISAKKDSISSISFKIREILKPSLYYEKYIIDIIKVNNRQTTGKSLLNIKKDSLQVALKVDAVYITKTIFEDLGQPLNPYQFNYKNYLKKKNIYYQIRLNNSELFPVSNKTHTVVGYANSTRVFINTKLKHYPFTANELAVINALFLGQRQELSKDIYNDYRNAGAIHILAISGLHIGIILILLNRILKPMERLKYGQILKAVFILIILWSFAITAGLSASVTRAVTMFSIVAVAVNLKRPTNIYNTLAISIFFILLFKPLYLFDVGFQLSYMAVFAIVSIDPILYKLWQPKHKLVDIYWHTITISIAAQFGIAPLLLYYFHQFSGLFLLSNLIIIPFLGIILGFGIVIILMASLNTLPLFLAHIFGSIISGMNYIISFISKQDRLIFNDIPFSIWHVLTSYLLIFSLIKIFKKWNYTNLKWFLFAIISFQLTFIYNDFSTPFNQFIVFHKSRFSLIGNSTKNKLKISHDLDKASFIKTSTIKNYTTGRFIDTIEETDIKSVYMLKNKKVLVVDSMNLYNIKSFKPDYVLLRQSPKINLNRLIDSIHPKFIIADGSNYKSYVSQWKAICKKRKLPFHNTNEKGAFVIEY